MSYFNTYAQIKCDKCARVASAPIDSVMKRRDVHPFVMGWAMASGWVRRRIDLLEAFSTTTDTKPGPRQPWHCPSCAVTS